MLTLYCVRAREGGEGEALEIIPVCPDVDSLC